MSTVTIILASVLAGPPRYGILPIEPEKNTNPAPPTKTVQPEPKSGRFLLLTSEMSSAKSSEFLKRALQIPGVKMANPGAAPSQKLPGSISFDATKDGNRALTRLMQEMEIPKEWSYYEFEPRMKILKPGVVGPKVDFPLFSQKPSSVTDMNDILEMIDQAKKARSPIGLVVAQQPKDSWDSTARIFELIEQNKRARIQAGGDAAKKQTVSSTQDVLRLIEQAKAARVESKDR